jgi:PAS domain S-box-containing protein
MIKEKPLNVLIVDDSSSDTFLITRELKNAGFKLAFERVDNAEDMEAALQRESWDVIIADFRMPRFDGISALKLAQDKGEDLPFILVSGAIGEELAASAMKAGAHDYVSKDNLIHLPEVIQRELLEAQIRKERSSSSIELRRLRDFHEEIVQNVFDGITVQDENGYFTFANPAVAELIGYNPGELVGMHWTEIGPEDQNAVVIAADERRLQGIADIYELDVIRKDGERRTVLISGSPRFDGERFVGTLAVFTDITERKQTEIELSKLKEFNEDIVQNVFEGICVSDADGFYTFANPVAAEMLGYQPGDLLGRHWKDTVPPDQHPIGQAADERRKQGISDRYELDLLHKNGSRISVLVSGSPIVEDDRLIGMLVVFTDISQLKSAERALSESEELYKTLIKASPDAVTVTNMEGTIIDVSQQVVELFGAQSVDDILGKNAYDFIAEEDHELAMVNQLRILEEGLVKNAEYTLLKTDGSRFVGESSAALIVDVDGNPSAFLATTKDITDRLKADKALHRRADELAALHAVSLDITASLDLPTLLHSIIERAMHMLNSPKGSLSLCDPDKEEVIIYEEHAPDGREYTGYVMKYGEGAAGIVAQTGEPLIVDDYRVWSHRSPRYEKDQPYSAVLSVPMIWHDQVIGVLQLMDDIETRSFMKDDLELMSLFADQAAIAIENARLLEAERKRRQEAETLSRAMRALTSTLDMDHVLNAILLQLSRVLPFDSACVFLIENGNMRVVAGRGFSEFDPQVGNIYPAKDALSEEMLHTRQALILEDAREDARFQRWGGTNEICGWMGVPLIFRGEIIGFLTTDSYRPAAYNQADASLAQVFANQAAIAIGNAQLFDEANRRAERMGLINEISTAVNQPLELNDVLQAAVDGLAQALNVDQTGLVLLDESRQCGTVMADHSASGISSAVGIDIPVSGNLSMERIIETKVSLAIADAQSDPLLANIRDVVSQRQMKSILIVPLIVRGEVIGTIACDILEAPRQFTTEEIELAETVANLTAARIEQARLFEAERTARNQAETMRDVAQVVSASLEPGEILRLILSQLKRVLTCDTASVFLFGDHGEPTLAAGMGYENEEITSRAASDLLKNSPILNLMAEKQKPVVIPDAHDFPGWIWVPGAEHVRSFLGVPIIVRDQMVGALMMDSVVSNFYTQDDVHVAQTLAQHMSIAIENARLFEAERAARERAEAMREATRVIGSMLALDQVLEAVLEQLARVLSFDSGNIMLVEDDQVVIKVWRGYDDYADPQMISSVQFDLEDDPTVGEVIRSGTSLVIPNVCEDPRWLITDVGEHIQSWLGVPLWVRDSVIGLVSLDRVTSGGFEEEEVALVHTFAAHAAAAINNANLFEAEEQRAAELMALRQASLSLTASLDRQAVLDAISESTLKLLPRALNTHIFLYHSGDRKHLEFGSALWVDGRRGQQLPNPRPDGLTNTVARTGEAVVVPDIRNHPLFSDPSFDIGWSGAVVGLPLKIGRRIVGVMNVGYSRPHEFTAAELRILNLLGDQAAIAIENSRLYERVAIERRHLGVLYDVGRVLVTVLDVDEVLSRAITHTCQGLGGLVGEAFYYLPDGDRLSLRAVHGLEVDSVNELDKQLDLSLGKGLAGWVAQHRIGANVPNVIEDSRWLVIPGVDEDVHSALVAPIIESDRLRGVLAVFHREPSAFSTDQLDLLCAICQQVGLALSNAERYQQVENLVNLLAEEQYLLESLVERLPVGVLLLDSKNRLLVANDLGRDIIAKFDPLEEDNVISRLGPYSLVDLQVTTSPTGLPGESLPVEIIIDGPPRCIIEAQARQIGGEARQWVITLRDVTQERENQERVNIQDRLATVGQLASGIAHDFNNIMAAILVYTELLIADNDLPLENRERLDIIQHQVHRASSLIRQILDFSRRSVMEQSPLDLLPFVKELDKLLSRVLPETIHIELVFQPGEYVVNADPTRLQQVFMNLALNARDAMPGGGELRFDLDRLSITHDEGSPHPDIPSGEWVRIRISDTGEGIPPDVIPHIYDPFFTTKPVGQGTGLGLAQVYGIVKQHGGTIEVSSQVGKGTQFSIYLPALDTHDDEHLLQEPQAEVDGAGAFVLVAEDDQVTRDAVQAILHAQNFQVKTAQTGVDALQVFELYGKSISLVVADMVMPEMGGVALFQALQERWPAVKMLFITGHPLELEDRALLEKGDVTWLQKPFSVNEFNEAVKGLIGKDGK